MQLPTIQAGAEAFFFRGGAVGCLCLHGFTASPAELRWMGEYLAEQGHTVYGPRLPGHATDPRDLLRLRWRDWYTAALDGWAVLRAQCEQVFVVGHSMGGLLALLLAANRPVAGAVIQAAPIQFRSRLIRAARWLKYGLRFTDQTDTSPLAEVIRAEQQRRGEAVVGRVRYDRWASAGVEQLYALSCETRRHLPEITAPLLLIYSTADRTVPPENLDLIRLAASGASVESHLLHQSDHILPQDIERETVFALTAGFIARHSNSSASSA